VPKYLGQEGHNSRAGAEKPSRRSRKDEGHHLCTSGEKTIPPSPEKEKKKRGKTKLKDDKKLNTQMAEKKRALKGEVQAQSRKRIFWTCHRTGKEPIKGAMEKNRHVSKKSPPGEKRGLPSRKKKNGSIPWPSAKQ